MMNTTITNKLRKNADGGDPSSQYELGAWYIARGTRDGIEQGKQYLKKAAVRNHLAAQILLGDIHIKSLCAPASNYKAGAIWYLKAAEQGSSIAQSRLGALYLSGIGVSQSDTDAFEWYRKAATNGEAASWCDLAHLYAVGVGVPSDEIEATNWYLKAAIEGKPRAYYNLGLRYAKGIGVTQDLAYACALLDHASKNDYPGSRTTLSDLSGQLSEQQIARRIMISDQLIDRLKQQSDPLLSLQPEIRCANAGVPHNSTSASQARKIPETEIVSWRPRVIKIHDFLMPYECHHLIDIALHHKGPSESLVDETLGKSLGTSFSGDTTLLDMAQYDPVLCLIDRRIAEATRVPPEHGEWISILGYGPGQSYAPHVDFFVTDDAAGKQVYEHVGQRLITFLMYLSDVEEGGETVYTEAGIKVAPEQGMAAMHYNCQPDGEVDPLTVHTSMPVIKGKKWLARKAICQRCLYVREP